MHQGLLLVGLKWLGHLREGRESAKGHRQVLSSGLSHHVSDLSGLVLGTHSGRLNAGANDGLVGSPGRSAGDSGSGEGKGH